MTFLLACLLLCSPCSSNALLEADEETYSPPGGRFAITFPGTPESKTQKARTPLDELSVHTATYATRDGNVFLVSYTDFPAEAARPANRNTLFEGVRNGLKGKDGKVLTTLDFTVGEDKSPGQELELEKGKQRIRIRVILHENRLYQVGVVGTAAFVKSDPANHFMKSFEITR